MLLRKWRILMRNVQISDIHLRKGLSNKTSQKEEVEGKCRVEVDCD